MANRNRFMRAYAPSIIVLSTVIVVLFAGPMAVRQLTFARTEATIELASNRLRDNSILEQLNQACRDIALKVEPSVVYISTRRLDEDQRSRLGSRPIMLSSGSGWVYDEAGHVVTNAHVIEDAERIEVQLSSGDTRVAEVVGTDLRTDIAVLRIAPGLLHPAERATSADVQQGDQVFAFGSPFDFRFSMSQGIVSGVGRNAQLEAVRYQNFIQVDAAINPGNSGGPLTDIYGRVIGMNTAIATGRRGTSSEGVFAGIGLAIPMQMIEPVVNQLIESGEVSRGFIGVELQFDLSRGTARSNGFSGEGVEVRSVTAGSPAELGDLLPGDVITHVNGTPVATLQQIQSMISSRFPGETITLRVWRYDRAINSADTHHLTITLTEMAPEQMVDRGILAFLRGLGFAKLATSTETRAIEHGVAHRRGVIVEQTLAGQAVDGIIDPGSIITHVGGEQVHNLDEFYARLERALVASPRGVDVTVILPDGREEVVTLRTF